MIVLAMGSVPWIVIGAVAFVAWVLGHRAEAPQAEAEAEADDFDDPDAPDADGFIPADKYGYGYGYSWGDPYGDPDL